MLKKLDELKAQAVEELAAISDKAELEALRVSKLGKKGVITSVLKQMGSLSAEERPIGGLGIHLVRQLMDSINYERTNGHNVLTLRKKLAD